MPEAPRNGLGHLVLVVGPSGAGKDTLIAGARARLIDENQFVFPARIVTRAASAAEMHGTSDETAFAVAHSEGAFALSWRAHGLSYGLPASIDDDIAKGLIVVANVSRHVIGEARTRYRHVSVVLVDAPPSVRAARLAARRRETPPDIAERLSRKVEIFDAQDADLSIDNAGTVEAGVGLFMGFLEDLNKSHATAGDR
jgi:ribose 1,5-bisphosphokinase